MPLGGMAERLKAPALKAGEGLRLPGVRIPVPPFYKPCPHWLVSDFIGSGSSSPQIRARVAWIFFSILATSSRLASTSACSASISATMARWVARWGNYE